MTPEMGRVHCVKVYVCGRERSDTGFANMESREVSSLEQLIDKASASLDDREASELKRILYGSPAE